MSDASIVEDCARAADWLLTSQSSLLEASRDALCAFLAFLELPGMVSDAVRNGLWPGSQSIEAHQQRP